MQFLGRVPVRLEAFEFDQIDGIFSRVTAGDVPDGIAIVRAVAAGARYLTYASVIDNLTGDPIYIPGVANTAAVRTNTPTRTPTQTPTGGPSLTPTPTPPGSGEGVTVTTLDEETFHLIPSSIRFRVGGGTQSSLVLCSFDGTLSQVNNSNFSFIRGPTETVEWMNCCSSTNFGARLEYETVFGAGGPAVARSTCTAGTPFFAIIGTEIDTGLTIEINGENLDLAEWP